MMIVYCDRSSKIKSSIASVLAGSSALQGSSHQQDLGTDCDGACDAKPLLLPT